MADGTLIQQVAQLKTRLISMENMLETRLVSIENVVKSMAKQSTPSDEVQNGTNVFPANPSNQSPDQSPTQCLTNTASKSVFGSCLQS